MWGRKGKVGVSLGHRVGEEGEGETAKDSKDMPSSGCCG